MQNKTKKVSIWHKNKIKLTKNKKISSGMIIDKIKV